MMSASPLGYPVTSAPPVSMAQALLTPPGASPKSSNRGSPCCENGRPVLTNPLTGQILCSCQYSPSSAAAAAAAAALYSGFPRIQISAASPVSVAGLPEALYSSAALAAHAHLLPFATVSPETAAQFYSGLASGYDYKGLASPAGLSYPFDPSLAAYPFGNGFLDPNARRKNATRESTATLKAWLNEHKKNPYPTKGEKIMLAIITKMTLTQVSTWFANARRRLKKDHKMTWEPRNRMDDEDDDDDRDDRQSAASDLDDAHDADLTSGLSGGMEATEEENISVDSDEEEPINPLRHSVKELSSTSPMATASTATRQSGIPHSPEHKATSHSDTHKDAPLKPKIWSMAEIATSNTNNSGNFRYGIKDIVPNMGLEALHQNKMPSAHAQALHPAWRGAHPYLQAHMLAQSRLAALSYPAHRLPTNPFSVPTSLPSALLHEARAASAFVPIANIPKASST